ncbi:hypothetical protein [Albibacterium profundi]|uniref:Uncharacterized protein n=1 Tax=Albibacterium profundi TaxID=3134906 RepID=A0ABV5C9S2_9SPHI
MGASRIARPASSVCFRISWPSRRTLICAPSSASRTSINRGCELAPLCEFAVVSFVSKAAGSTLRIMASAGF